MKVRPTILVLTVILSISCSDTSKSSTSNTTKELVNLQNKVKEFKSPKLMHTVYVWLKDGLREEELSEFLQDAESLRDIESVSRIRIGRPAKTEKRDVVDHSFSYAMNIEFDSIEDQDAYQIDTIHLKFVEKNKDKWEKVIVYDNLMDQ